MMLAMLTEWRRCYRIDRARYHAAMDEYWAQKRREKWERIFCPMYSRSARWAQKKRPNRGNG